MNFRHVEFDSLTRDELDAWSAIQQATPALSNPLFRPEFTQLVASVRDDVEVAVLEEQGRAVGFFPFQRTWFGAGRPVGNGLSEFHALIAPPEVHCDPAQLLRACGLSSWRFDHLVPLHDSFARFAWSAADSPYIDLRGGFERYIARRSNGRRLMTELARLKRKCQRELGPVRYVPHVDDPAVLDTCLRWKAAQAERTGRVDIFKYAWLPKLLHRALAVQDDHFAAAMPACYAGDRLVAVNFGVRCGGVFHPWFPTFDVEFANLSPGQVLWLEMMQAAPSSGIHRIILGKGDEAYKQRLMSGADRVTLGCVDLHPAMATARRSWRQTRQWLKDSPLRRPAQVPARLMHRISTWLAFR